MIYKQLFPELLSEKSIGNSFINNFNLFVKIHIPYIIACDLETTKLMKEIDTEFANILYNYGKYTTSGSILVNTL